MYILISCIYFVSVCQITIMKKYWNCDQGDYNRMREKGSAIPWDDLQHDDINIYADNIFSTIATIAREFIPNIAK